MEALKSVCYARFLNACSYAPHVDIIINDKLIAGNFSYGSFSEYFSGQPGIYHLAVYPAGKHDKALIDEHLEMDRDSVYTIAAAGRDGRPELSLICDRKRTLHKSKAHVRFINLSACGSINIFLNDSLSIPELSYHETSDYVPLTPGSVSITAKDTVTGKTVMSDYKMPLEADCVYGGYFTGLMDGDPGLRILTSAEGTGHLKL